MVYGLVCFSTVIYGSVFPFILKGLIYLKTPKGNKKEICQVMLKTEKIEDNYSLQQYNPEGNENDLN